MKTIIKNSALFILLALFFGCVQSGDKSGQKNQPLETTPKVQNAKVSSMDDVDDLTCDGTGGACVQIDAIAGTQFTICFELLNGTSNPIFLNSAKAIIYQNDTPADSVITDNCQGTIAINQTLLPGKDTIISRNYCVPTDHIFTPNAKLGFNVVYKTGSGQTDTTYILTRCTSAQ